MRARPAYSYGGALLPSQLTLGVGVADVLSAAQYRFSAPDQVKFDGSHLWIADTWSCAERADPPI